MLAVMLIARGNRELKCAKTCKRGFPKSAGRCLQHSSGMIARNITVLALNIVTPCTPPVRKHKRRGKRRAPSWRPSRNCNLVGGALFPLPSLMAFANVQNLPSHVTYPFFSFAIGAMLSAAAFLAA